MAVKMKQVMFLEDYYIKISLQNGHCIIYNMKPRLKTVRFHELRDHTVFSGGRLVKGKIIVWSDNIELTLAEILLQVADYVPGHENKILDCREDDQV